MSWIDTYIAGYWSKFQVACTNDADSLSLFRVLWTVFVLAFFTPHFSWLGNIPQGLFNPPILSLAALFWGFPPKWVFVAVDVGLVVSIVFVGLGIKARASAIAAVAFAIFGSSFQYSFGKIDHAILLWATLLCLSQTSWSSRFAVWPDKPSSPERSETALALAGLLVAFGMFTAGLPKLIFWVDFDGSTSGFLAWFYEGYFSLNRQLLAAPLVFMVPEQAFEIFDYSAALFEISAFACLLAGRRAWHIWLLVACVFHLGNTIFLNISFINHVPVYLMFFPLAKLTTFKRLCARRLPAAVALLFLGTANIVQGVMEIRFALDALPALLIATILWSMTAIIIGACIYREMKDTRHLNDMVHALQTESRELIDKSFT